jgi:MFS family permease
MFSFPRQPVETMTGASTAPRKIWHVGTLTYTAVGLVILFCWLLWGDFAWSMKDRAIPPTMQLLLKKFGASDTFAGLVFGSIPSVLGMLLGPMISYKSDRHRGRWGRRIPFLLASTPFMVLGMIGLAFSPMLGTYTDKLLGPHSLGLNMSVLVFFALFWAIFELACAASNAIYGALVNDVVPQPLLGRFYGLFRALSLIAGIIFYDLIFGKAETFYVWIFLGLATLYGVGFTLMCLNVKEGEYPLQLPMDEGRPIRGVFAAAKTYFGECFGKSYYLWYFGAFNIAGMANVPFNLFSVFYSKSIGMSPNAYGKCLALTYVISLTLAYPIGWLADRFHPLRLWLGVMIIYSLMLLASYLFVQNIWTFSIALVAHGVISGTAGTASASIGQRLLPRAEFAQFNSAAGIINGLCWMLLSPVVGIFLDHAHHHYRYTFLMSSCIGMAGSVALAILHAKFMALGGPRNYVAPE